MAMPSVTLDKNPSELRSIKQPNPENHVNVPFSFSSEDKMTAQLEMRMSSPEAEIRQRLQQLIQKVADGDATDNDRQLLQDLQKLRVENMHPRVLKKKRALAAAE